MHIKAGTLRLFYTLFITLFRGDVNQNARRGRTEVEPRLIISLYKDRYAMPFEF
jgi:hypothetical protein